MYDKPLSLLSVSSQPDIYPKHSHNIMGNRLSEHKLCFIRMMSLRCDHPRFRGKHVEPLSLLHLLLCPISITFDIFSCFSWMLPFNLCDLWGHLLHTKGVLLCYAPGRYLAKLSSVGSIRDEETCERLRGLIQRQVHTSTR